MQQSQAKFISAHKQRDEHDDYGDGDDDEKTTATMQQPSHTCLTLRTHARTNEIENRIIVDDNKM